MNFYNQEYIQYIITIKIFIYTSQLFIIIKQKGNCYDPIEIKCGYTECGLYNICLGPRKSMPTYSDIYKEAIIEFKKYFSEEVLFEELL